MNLHRKEPLTFCFFVTLLLVIIQPAFAGDDWQTLFDGRTLNGWRPSENKASWQVENGCLVTKGPRSHLFYIGDVCDHNFKNFELTAHVKTKPGSNSGIFFHTEYQETGWLTKGYECQIYNSPPKVKPGSYIERKMTGSLYGIRNTAKSPVQDNEWFNYRILVQGQTIRTYINDVLIVDYTQPVDPFRPEKRKGRVLSTGTFALQCHDPGSMVHIKNIKVKPLPDDAPTLGEPPADRVLESQLVQLASSNYPLMDLHVHLKRGLTLKDALKNARQYGFTYGFAINCGLRMPYQTDNAVHRYLDTYQKPAHTYLAMQAEGREWMDLFSKETIAQFDYVFTDAMTWTNNQGRRMRLWIPAETEVGDPQDFMEQLVDHIVKIVTTEPIQIYVNATYLPREIQDHYEELWTLQRMDRVIKALVDSKVAMEISARYRIPSPAFIKRAKAAGVKFTFGTNNRGADDLGKLAYCIDMVQECDLVVDDFWIPQR